MPRIEEVFNTNLVLDYINDLERNYTLGDALFPDMKIDDVELDMIVGGNNLPVAASVHAWDSEAEIGEREGFEVIRQELALVKRKIPLHERDIIRLENPRTNAELDNVLQKVYDDVGTMVETVRTRFEAMKFEVLATGKLSFNENGYRAEIDYGVDEENRVTADWGAEGADPIQDIYDWMTAIAERTGETPTRILTSTKIASNIESNEIVKRSIFGNSGQMVTREDLNNFLLKKGLPVIATDDRTYRVKKNGKFVTKRFFPEGKLVLLPGTELGNMVFGRTAEEIRLASNAAVDVNAFNEIVAAVYDEFDPVATWTKAVAVGLPTFPVANKCVFAEITLP